MKLCCSKCGSEVVTSGRCWVCHNCGEDGCGTGNLKVVKSDEKDSD